MMNTLKITQAMATLVIAGIGSVAQAAPFTFLHPDFGQELIVAAEVGGAAVRTAGVTQGLDGAIYTSGNGSGTISKWDPSSRIAINGSSVSGFVASASGSQDSGYGLATDSAGGIYSLGSGGLYSIDQTTLAGTYIGNAGTFGLAYDRVSDSFFSSAGFSVLQTFKDGTSATLTSITGGFIDQVAVDPSGQFVAGAHCCSASTGSIHVWDKATGLQTAHIDLDPNRAPDGIAFDADGNIFTNNIDGTVVRIEFGAGGYAAGATGQTLIASGGFYGDLAGVGADGSFYLSQYGTRYDDGTTSGRHSIVRISLKGGGGFQDGGTGGVQDPGNGGNGGNGGVPVPEPGSLALLGLGLMGMGVARKHKKG